MRPKCCKISCCAKIGLQLLNNRAVKLVCLINSCNYRPKTWATEQEGRNSKVNMRLNLYQVISRANNNNNKPQLAQVGRYIRLGTTPI